MHSDILISVVYTEDWQGIIDLTKPGVVKYCEKHGYRYTYTKYKRGLKDFDKIRTLLEILQQGYYEYVWQIDGDLAITNPDIPLEQYLDDTHDFFVCKDISGINSGSFVIKSTKWGKWFLAWLLGCEWTQGHHCEQDSMTYFTKLFPSYVESKIKFLPQSTINSYMYELYPEFGLQTEENGQWIEGKSLALHLPAIGMEKRVEIFKQLK